MIFLDTNILVYAYDIEEEEKHQKAKEILIDCWDNHSGAISTQVLQEFCVTVTRKLPKKLPTHEAREIIKDFLPWSIYRIEPANVVAASELGEKYGYSFWDSLIIIAAQNTGAEILYSEDLQDGQQLNGLRIVNPFR
jgi:predicted nucleic acid-binding protein